MLVVIENKYIYDILLISNKYFEFFLEFIFFMFIVYFFDKLVEGYMV